MKSSLSLFRVLPLILILGCTSHRSDTAVNSTATDSVLAHYSRDLADSLKYKAAKYLIDNMDGWSYYEGEQLDHYQDYLKLIRRDQEHGEYYMYSFNQLYGQFSLENLTKRTDSGAMHAEDMIRNIDMAFAAWKEQPWGRAIGFQQFCAYILPFRIDNEVPDRNRKAIYDQFDPALDSIRRAHGSALQAGAILNDALSKQKWIFTLRTSFLPHFRASQIINYRAGSCREMTDLAFYTMRATGIPVAIDFIPQWPYRSMGHEFNALIDSNGRSVMFLGAEDDPGTPHKPGAKIGKVYRHMYAKNPWSLAMIKGRNDTVPRLFEDPRLSDVTDQYIHTVDLCVPAQPTRHFAYITVFNNTSWVPIGWGKVSNGQALFPRLEGNIVYLEAYYTGGKIVPANDPLILDEDGSYHFLKADRSRPIPKIKVSAIFPVLPDDYDYWHMTGCKFQGANKPDFSDAVDLYTIPEKPNPFWNAIPIKNTRQFRYLRYFGAEYTHMGEMEFYAGAKKLKGTAIGSKIGWYKNKTFDKATDGDVYTSFDPAGANNDTCWTGLDLARAQTITGIRFSAPVFEGLHTAILPGHRYELFFWENDGWVSAGEQHAVAPSLSFDHVPSNALYLLRDKTQKTDARIFTYQDGKQVWW